MKKVLIIAAIAAGAYFLLGNKKTDDTAAAVTDVNTDNSLENYLLIESDTGYVFAVKNGKRWYVTSDKAGADFYEANGSGLDYTPTQLQAYTSAQLAAYPIGGALLEGNRFE